MRPITVTVGPLAAASANSIAQAQTVLAGGSFVLNGASAANGVAILDMARRVAITSAANDSANLFTISGTDRSGRQQTETLAGGNAATAVSALDYATVTSITSSVATAGNVTAGTTGVASSAWARMDEWAPGAPVAVSAVVTGTVGYTVEQTFDDPNSNTNPVPAAACVWFPIESASASGPAVLGAAPIFVRVTATSGVGAVRATIVQYGSSNLNMDIVRA